MPGVEKMETDHLFRIKETGCRRGANITLVTHPVSFIIIIIIIIIIIFKTHT